MMPSRSSANQNRRPMSDAEKHSDRLPVSEAKEVIREFELNRAIDENEVRRAGLKRAEESGIIFLDEIDKLCSDGHRGDYKGYLCVCVFLCVCVCVVCVFKN